jgi:broad specificity phosphatase PhoE
MTILLLIRHGENDYLKKGILIGSNIGVHLNSRGREQAAVLAKTLKDLPIKAVYSSPLERALETAEPFATAKKLEINLCPTLRDTDVGDWAGRKLKDLRKFSAWKQVQEKPSTFTFPGGESFIGLQARLVEKIGAIAAAHKQKDLVAIFFHADPIKLVIAHYLELPLDGFQRLRVDTGSISILAIGKTGARLEALNLKPPMSFSLP